MQNRQRSIERKIDKTHDNMQHGSDHTVTSQTTDANLSARRDSYTRDQNVVVFGVSETSDWQKQLSDFRILQLVDVLLCRTLSESG